MNSLERLEEELKKVDESKLTRSYWCEREGKAFVVHHCHDALGDDDIDVHSKEYWGEYCGSGDVLSNVTREEALRFIEREFGQYFILEEISY